MMLDETMKKGDKVIYGGKIYEISHSVAMSHENVGIWLNKKNKSWDMVDKKLIERVIQL